MNKDRPRHWIDTPVFVQAATSPKSKTGNACRAYLERLHWFEWVLGPSTVYELLQWCLDKPKATADQVFNFFWNLYWKHRPRLVSGDIAPAETLKAILGKQGIPFMGMLHMSSAANRADVFVTTNKQILADKRMEKALRMEIAHPSALI